MELGEMTGRTSANDTVPATGPAPTVPAHACRRTVRSSMGVRSLVSRDLLKRGVDRQGSHADVQPHSHEILLPPAA